MKETPGFLKVLWAQSGAVKDSQSLLVYKIKVYFVESKHGLRIANQRLKKIISTLFDLKRNIFQLRFFCVKSLAVFSSTMYEVIRIISTFQAPKQH